MDYPRIEIDVKKIKHNIKQVVDLCSANAIDVAGVTKVFCAHPGIVKAYIDGGVKYLADSRIENLKRLKEFNLPKILLRLPMISEAKEVVEYADISLNSEIATIKALSRAAGEIDIIHRIILMIDLGDLREGYFEENELFNSVKEVLELKNIKLMGIATNLTCYGGVIPSTENLGKLTQIAKSIEKEYDINLQIISGGNSSTLHLLLKDTRLPEINMLRLGESLVLGCETAYGTRIDNTYNDAFQLVAEIIEIKTKPSIPIGEIGRDAFGKVPTFEDRGTRKRMIAAIGKQDVEFDSLIPHDKGIIILGGSSDHLLLDGTESNFNYKIGDKIRFNLNYGGILRIMTSEYVKKHIS